ALVVTIVASVAFLCCACGVAVVVCVYRRNRALHRPPPPQTQPTYPMEAGGRYGTNGTFGTLLVEKPPPYPGVPQHTSVIPPGTTPSPVGTGLSFPGYTVGCSARYIYPLP
ncbi:hypothetical protein OTU49_011749, partial [Cherax quadricarinatus]